MSKTLFITGANRGIGLALTRTYLSDGWQVIATCRNPENSTELTTLLDEFEKLDIFALDVTNYDDVAELSIELKGAEFDVLINNAGYYGPKGYGFGETDINEWRKVFEINTIAPLKLIESFYPQLKSARGLVVNMSSKMGSMGDNSSGGSYIYRSSKAALNAVTKSLSLDGLIDGVNAVALHPGWVQTDMGGPNALITPLESATGLKYVLDNFTKEQNGGFFDPKGNPIPW
ncbi:SDR family oxidoreductase [Parashewanella curva]|uniref:SDR family oxidoreductase n=1 Tax=Parashewanella curva TaxID=2338552 RepID=A0A3L8Q0F7_9GAMM|nr:SDR family oxidoreductase [Parashewanella curva]RLV61176.1 SDR family oxidoreductase [Parashewanella curva]